MAFADVCVWEGRREAAGAAPSRSRGQGASKGGSGPRARRSAGRPRDGPPHGRLDGPGRRPPAPGARAPEPAPPACGRRRAAPPSGPVLPRVRGSSLRHPGASRAPCSGIHESEATPLGDEARALWRYRQARLSRTLLGAAAGDRNVLLPDVLHRVRGPPARGAACAGTASWERGRPARTGAKRSYRSGSPTASRASRSHGREAHRSSDCPRDREGEAPGRKCGRDTSVPRTPCRCEPIPRPETIPCPPLPSPPRRRGAFAAKAGGISGIDLCGR